MEVVEVSDAAEFWHLAEDFLVRNEAANNLILGVSGAARDRPHHFDDYHSWVVDKGGEVVGAAVMATPDNLILAHGSDETVYELLAHKTDEIPGVIGSKPGVDQFVAQRQELVSSKMEQGVFELTSVKPPSLSTGMSRPAEESEIGVLVEWFVAFSSEALGHVMPRYAALMNVSARIDSSSSSGLWVHEMNGRLVSMSGYGGPTPNGIRISAVYTPPVNRGQGYASALVANQSQWLLDRGYRFCFLFTDLSNPTSNSIYQRIGYRQVVESIDVRFA